MVSRTLVVGHIKRYPSEKLGELAHRFPQSEKYRIVLWSVQEAMEEAAQSQGWVEGGTGSEEIVNAAAVSDGTDDRLDGMWAGPAGSLSHPAQFLWIHTVHVEHC
jgi:hypothetical protein